jgi:hypothetical protein
MGMHKTHTDQQNRNTNNDTPDYGINYIALDKWAGDLGRSRPTIHRWRIEGIIREQDVRRFYGKNYISRAGREHIDALIESGEHAKPLHGCAAEAHDRRTAQLVDIAKDNGEDAAEIAKDEMFKRGEE